MVDNYDIMFGALMSECFVPLILSVRARIHLPRRRANNVQIKQYVYSVLYAVWRKFLNETVFIAEKADNNITFAKTLFFTDFSLKMPVFCLMYNLFFSLKTGTFPEYIQQEKA